MESSAEQLAMSAPVKVKCESVVKEEPEWVEEAAKADLYEDHEIKEDLTFGPEILQEQDIARSKQTLEHLEQRSQVKSELQMVVKKKASNHESEGNYGFDVPLSNSDMQIKEEKCWNKLEPPNEVKREPEYVYTSPWEIPRMSLEQQFKLKSCFVRLKRIPLGDPLTNTTGPGTLHCNLKQGNVNSQATSHQPSLSIPIQTSVGEPVSCNFCGKRFTKKSDFTRHIRIHTGEKPYSCDICHKRFADNSRLARHIRIHKKEAPHCCDVCHKVFVQKSDFNRHLLSHMGEKPHVCNICCKPFAKQSDLARHVRVHTGEKPYSCDICDKQFADRSILTRHKRVHSGVKSYSCNICDKRFVQMSHLNRHVLIHTGEKPFICDVCKKRFTQKQTLIGHLRMHTGEKPYDCHICHKKFVAKSPLTKHLKGHEGAKRDPHMENDSSLLKIALVKKRLSKFKRKAQLFCSEINES